MYCIDNRCADIYFNLAAEEYLMKHRQEDFFMLWQSDPAVVVGKYQSVRAEVDESFLHRQGISLARRLSGGGAVYHDRGNLNLTFTRTVGQPDFSRYPQALAGFLRSEGIPALVNERRDIRLGAPGGGKISGSAQCVFKNRILYHCTLLLDTNLKTLKAALNGTPQEAENTRAVPSVHSPVANIGGYLPHPPDTGAFRDSLLDYFSAWGGESHRYNFSREDTAAIGRIRAEKYATEIWTYHKP